jgi:hypothetical protein
MLMTENMYICIFLENKISKVKVVQTSVSNIVSRWFPNEITLGQNFFYISWHILTLNKSQKFERLLIGSSKSICRGFRCDSFCYTTLVGLEHSNWANVLGYLLILSRALEQSTWAVWISISSAPRMRVIC